MTTEAASTTILHPMSPSTLLWLEQSWATQLMQTMSSLHGLMVPIGWKLGLVVVSEARVYDGRQLDWVTGMEPQSRVLIASQGNHVARCAYGLPCDLFPAHVPLSTTLIRHQLDGAL